MTDYDHEQINIFSVLYPKFIIDKPIRLIETFAGIGAQAKALERLGVNFEHWKVIEFDKYPVASYNAIHGTDYAPIDIRDVHAEDLDMRERERYCYILSYSFPCQDLSLAGKMSGMSKGSGTRSGLLWEVERILDECNGELPHVLLMENVPQVIGSNNIEDFKKWERKLETLGYQNYVEILNSKDYGIPQNRSRCFMVSILGDYSYTFPRKQKLTLQLKDLLEDEVDEKYYLSEELVSWFIENSEKQKALNNGFRFDPYEREREREVAKTISTKMDRMEVEYVLERLDTSNVEPDNISQTKSITQTAWHEQSRHSMQSQLSRSLNTVERERENGIAIPQATKKGYAIAGDGDGVYINRPHQKRGVVQKGMIQTIKTSPDIGVVIEDEET